MSPKKVVTGPKFSRILFGGGVNQVAGFKEQAQANINKGQNNSAVELTHSSGSQYTACFGRVSDLKDLADNSVCAVKFMYTFERLDDDLMAFMKELYRVCCDGAHVEICTCAPSYFEDSGDLLIKRKVNEKSVLVFDAQFRQSATLNPAFALSCRAFNDTAIDFKTLRSTLNLNVELLEQIRAAKLEQDPQAAVDSATLVREFPTLAKNVSHHLVCRKGSDHHYGLAYLEKLCGSQFERDDSVLTHSNANNDILPFVMRIYDPADAFKYVSAEIAKNGCWELNETEFMASLLALIAKKKGNANLANIGANLGWYALIAAKLSHQIHVDAFEPNPTTFGMLEHNVNLSQLHPQIKLHQIALSNEKGEVDFYINENNDGNSSLADEQSVNLQNHQFTKIKVKTDTLDNLYAKQDKSKWPDLILIDTEGHEQLVFDGANKLFEQGFRPLIMAEYCPRLLNLRGKTTYYRDLVEKFGYKVYSINNSARNTLGLETPEHLDALYESLQTPVDNDSAYLNLIFVPEYIEFTEQGMFYKD